MILWLSSGTHPLALALHSPDVDSDAFERSEARAYLQFDHAVLRAAALRCRMLQQQQACIDVCRQYRGLWHHIKQRSRRG